MQSIEQLEHILNSKYHRRDRYFTHNITNSYFKFSFIDNKKDTRVNLKKGDLSHIIDIDHVFKFISALINIY